MKYFLYIISILLLSSCSSEIKAKFEIENKTNHVIDSINIKSFDHERKSQFIKLEPDQTETYWLDMTELPKVDGDYLLTFKRNRTNKEIERFGYFTNGYPLEEVTKIRIEKDTVIIDQIFDDY
jgi:hypothetical protein